ncbi:Uncharacterised protein [Stutzerimonas stutzeri]|uniref:oligosaccharide repeat unit polymerase n=1 Tax=Stutzerimonas stutzeri subgroup TaxID=578833 RepID=UPI000F6CB5D6|nr:MULTISPECIES: oligosaccharide repeat unit polymerase [Stutzerimonas stutzeri subgroup]MCQ2047197.1 oligosaccharide repeat unit polymerase [Stutzerimonas kunmingensis]QQC10083.1 oligosaccharide repeat unit polymerase [Stutzerimonas stutzeri]VEI33869.1 Uncharacterised protein [Stutzerimonas stutzeri]
MIFFLSGLSLAVFALCVFVYFFFFKQERDLLSPAYVLWFYFIVAIPYYFVVSVDSDFFNVRILKSPLALDLEWAVFYSAILTVFSFSFALLGSLVRFKGLERLLVVVTSSSFFTDKGARVFPWLFVFFVGVAVLVNHLREMGGLLYIWSNIGSRTELQEGLGYSMFFFEWLIILGGIGAFLVLYNRSLLKKVFAVLLVLLAFTALGLTGGRAPQLLLVWVLIFVVHFKFRALSFGLIVRFMPVVVFVFLIFSIVGMHRASFYDGEDLGARSLFKEFFMTVTQRLSDLDRNVALVSYFDLEEVWLGASYLNLIYAPLPRGWIEGKPAISDGRYVRTIIDRGAASANMASEELVGSSWPPRNWIGFMNFHVVGLAAFYFINGLLLSAIYRALKASGALYLVVFYAAVCWGGGVDLSVSGLVRVTMIAFVLLVGFFLYCAVPRIGASKR